MKKKKSKRITYTAENGTLFIKYLCFCRDGGQKSERWMSMPLEAYRWFRDNVKLATGGGGGRPHIFWWHTERTTLRRLEGRHDLLCEYLRGLFGYLYDGLRGQGLGGRKPFRREEILGLANHLCITPKLTGKNPNPNKDNTVNLSRYAQVVFAPGGKKR